MLDLNKDNFYQELNWCLKPYHGTTEWLGNGKTSQTIVSLLKDRI
jgi:hypothetical protein